MKSSFSRYLTAATVLLMATLVITGFFFRVLVLDYVKDRNFDTLKNDAEVLGEVIRAAGGGRSPELLLSISIAAAVSDADAVICDASGRLLLCSDAPMGCAHVGKMLQSSYLQRCFEEDGCQDIGKVAGLYEDERYVVAEPVYTDAGAPMAVVIVSQGVDSMAGVASTIIGRFVAVSVLVVAVAQICTIILAHRQTKPLHDMAEKARAFGHGELTARVSVDDRDSREVQELALAFNNMASSLEKSEYQRQEFVANVSHELKTPMTTISGYLDGILDGTIPPDKERPYLRLVSDETKRLSRLVRSMLDISRLQDQGGFPEEQLTRFDLQECVGRALLSFEGKINDKKLEVAVNFLEHPVFTRGSEDSITQVVYNLIDNAIKFSPEGGPLEISLREGDKKAYVSVSNGGETIPPEELPLVFDRFHKIDKSRAKNRESWGLGLYIVKTIMDLHGENISVASRDGRTTFTFTMPLVI